MLSFLGRLLFLNGFSFVYLWGEMESTRQEACIKAFQQETEIKVMVGNSDTCSQLWITVDKSLANLRYLRRARLELDRRQPRHCLRPLVA